MDNSYGTTNHTIVILEKEREGERQTETETERQTEKY